ncbi:flagellin N-terminal helical domain-containing protein [Aquipuribacter sp. SD81]|uniref:flagellin N-terminal helical domain-containing protein n=1 Tax=Aquipuribacter sp. SD81 TaxID=3127703 RepID=UPI003016C953
MGLQINNNIAAFNSYRNLSVNQGNMEKSLEKLSSGLRINRAADDAAGLAISEGLRSQVGGLKQAVRNAQDGISVVQTAEGALQEVHSILQRGRDLQVQAANGSNNQDSLDAINAELTALASEIGAISTRTNFNGVQLLDGTANLNFQTGARSTEQLNVDLTTIDLTAAAGVLTAAAGANTGGVGSTADINLISAQITAISAERGNLGASQNRLESTIKSLNVAVENLTASESRIRDTDMALEMVSFTKSQILSQAGTAMLAQANQAPQGVLQLLR